MSPMNTPIDLKRVITRIPFKIEPKSDGGFIARATDPTVPAIEAPTREELHQKILAAIGTEFPAFKIPANGTNTEVSLELKTGNDEFFISNQPDSTGNTSDLESRVLQKVLGVTAKHLTPELVKQLAAQAGTASFQVMVNNKTALRINSGPNGLTFGAPKNPALPNAASGIPKLDAGAGIIDGQPITPEPSNISRVLKIIVWVIIIGTFAYLYFLSRH
jgi:hypothetical protein